MKIRSDIAEEVDFVSPIWEGKDRQQAMEANVDVRRFSGLGQKNRGLP